MATISDTSSNDEASLQFPYDVARACAAASLGDLENLKALAAAQPHVLEGTDYDNRSPLHVAASRGRLEVVQYLLGEGADVNAEDRWGATPLRDALRSKNAAVVEVLRNAGAVLTDRSGLAINLCKAGAAGDIAQISRVLDQGADVNDKDYDGRTALHLASAKGHIDAVRFLVEHGADVNAKDRLGTGGTPIVDAVRHQHTAVVEFLRSHGAVLHDVASVELCRRVLEGDMDGLSALVRGGADVNAVDYDRRSALHVAACAGNDHMVRFLAEHGALLDAADRWGGTPLGDAIHHGHEGTAELLRELGAKNDAADVSETRRAFSKGTHVVSESDETLEAMEAAAVVQLGVDSFGHDESAGKVAKALARVLEKDTDEGARRKAAAAASAPDLLVAFLSGPSADTQGGVPKGPAHALWVDALRALALLGGVDELAPPLAKCGAVRVAVDGLATGDASIARPAAQLLSNISFPAAMDVERVCMNIVRENGIQVILGAIKTLEEQPVIVDKCVSCLWNLMTVSSTNVERIHQNNGSKDICSVWQLHQNHAGVSASCAGALSSLLCTDESRQAFLNSNRGDALVIHALRKHAKEQTVVSPVIALLCHFAATQRAALAKLILRNKGFQAVLGAMKTFPDDIAIQENGATIIQATFSAVPKSARQSQLVVLKKMGADKVFSKAHKEYPDSESIKKANSQLKAAGCSIC
eukprot:TRINITY_DN1237_c0_g1_i1.p1 TRINITY_DN1237_c0_g1~~TRINITY_DN1237_c0_g1_i1.p1  ORF type:complete len:700 (+),score=298.04 TRINITY_DN1237_c0_g1_i1:87-2186(+)